MEEKKNNEKKELTFDELKTAAEQWYQEKEFYKKKCNELASQIQGLNISNALKRVEFLFEVIKNPASFDKDFVKECALEIQDGLTLPKEEPKKEEEKK